MKLHAAKSSSSRDRAIALDAVDKGCDEAFARTSDPWLTPLFDCDNHHGTRFAMIVTCRDPISLLNGRVLRTLHDAEHHGCARSDRAAAREGSRSAASEPRARNREIGGGARRRRINRRSRQRCVGYRTRARESTRTRHTIGITQRQLRDDRT